METRRIGIIMNGVTGRMGTNQHLIRSIKAIRDQGGLKVGDDLVIMPDPILTGRNHDKLKALAERTGVTRFTTDVDAALANPDDEIFFDASGTLQRAGFVEKAVKAGKAIYCEKPTAVETSEALRLAKLVRGRGREKWRGAGQALADWAFASSSCCGIRASSAASSVCAASSATGSSPVKMVISLRSAHRGTTARKTAVASSWICSATGVT